MAVECEEVPDVAPEIQRHLVLMAQESLSNALRHARATTVTIRLHAAIGEHAVVSEAMSRAALLAAGVAAGAAEP